MLLCSEPLLTKKGLRQIITMSQLLSNIYAFSGRFVYRLVLPAIRLVIKRTTRSYVLLECEGSILVIKNSLSRQNWQLPGGGVKRNETPASAAIREIAEEMNIELRPANLELLTKGRWQTDKLGYDYYVYVAHCSKKPEFKLRSYEIIDARWLEPKKLKHWRVAHEILDCLNLAGF
jgi:8-oxo-dGTP pyrophosphatase MutT (NUDIX family)